MSRRTKLKLNNIHKFLSRNIFTTKYIVRNTLCIMILCAVAAIAAIFVYAAGESKKEDEKTAIILVGESEINSGEVSLIDASTVMTLQEEMNAYVANKRAVEVQAVSVSDESEEGAGFIVTVDSLNIRAEADEASDVLGRLAKNAVGEVLGVNGDWTNISSGGITGYVKTEYILTGAEAEAAMADAEKKFATVVSSSVRVRSEASTEADIIMLASAGDRFVADETFVDEQWTRVRLVDYTYGYIASEYLSMSTGYEEAVSMDEINSFKADRASEEDASDEADSEEVSTESAEADEDEKDTDDAEAANSKDNKKDESSQESTSQNETKIESNTEKNDEAASGESDQTSKNDEENIASNEITIATTSRGSFNLSEEDVYLLACIVYAESGGESYEGQLAVANVVLNRLQKGSWGSTVSDVIYASGQFTAVNSSAFSNALENGPGSTALSAAQAAASGTNNIGSFTSFRSLRRADTDAYSSYTIIGNHCFF